MSPPNPSNPSDRGDGLRPLAGLDAKSAALARLQGIIERLRGPQGCPWDRQQTLPSLAPNFQEEAAELVDAIAEAPRENGQHAAAIREELGDILMNIFLAARIAEEAGGFDLGAVSDAISDKLVRRHPHVFGQERIDDVAGVLSRWEAIKAAEKPAGAAEPASVLDRVPRSLSPLAAAAELGRRAAKLGFDWPELLPVLAKVREEVDEVEACLAAGADADADKLAAEIGDLLFAVAQLARKADISPEAALRASNRKFRRRFAAVEAGIAGRAAAGGAPLTLEEMEELWQQCKKRESGSSR